MKIEQGMKLKNADNGQEFEVLEVLPFGRLSMGQRKVVSDTFKPVVKTWENTQRNVCQHIESGGLQIV